MRQLNISETGVRLPLRPFTLLGLTELNNPPQTG